MVGRGRIDRCDGGQDTRRKRQAASQQDSEIARLYYGQPSWQPQLGLFHGQPTQSRGGQYNFVFNPDFRGQQYLKPLNQGGRGGFNALRGRYSV